VFRGYRDEVWTALQRAMNEDGAWDGRAVRVHHPPFVVTVDVNAQLAGYASEVETRLRAAFPNPRKLRFRMVRQAWKSRLAQRLGLHDVEVGDPAFDAAFWIRAHDADPVRRLLSDPKLRDDLAGSPAWLVEVRDDDGWFGQEFPAGVDMLLLEAPGRVTDPEAIGAMYDAMARLLDGIAEQEAESAE
jgi:hypothetical protein